MGLLDITGIGPVPAQLLTEAGMATVASVADADELTLASIRGIGPVSAESFMADRRRAGQPLSAPDGQIAATASSHGFQLATRNIRDFTNCGLVLVNPFEYVPAR